MKLLRWILPSALLLISPIYSIEAGGKLEGPVRMHSSVLGYDLQFWVYLPEDDSQPLPELYLTDGQVYLGSGEMKEVLDDEIDNGKLPPIAAIFVDSRDPDYPEETRRNREFMCNADYARFYVGELMPKVSELWTGAGPTTTRGMMGVSFGAINSACFGMMLPGVFQVLIMQSPGSNKHIEVINQLYQDKPRNSSAIFLSHGGPDDNEMAARQFVMTLKEKGYPVEHVSTGGGHDWDNWRPQLGDILSAFAAVIEENESSQ